jgi:ATP-binding cassette subfamily B (MDR/TAP) protein 1
MGLESEIAAHPGAETASQGVSRTNLDETQHPSSRVKEGAAESTESSPSGSSTTGSTDSAAGADAKPDKVAVTNVSLSQLFRFSDRTDKTLMIAGGIAAFINGAGLPAFAEIFGRLINRLATNPPDVANQVAEIAVIMVYVGLVVMVLSAVQVMTWMIAAERQTNRLRRAYFDALLRQDAEFFDNNKPGGLAARLVGDSRVVKAGINDKAALGIMNFGMFIFGYGFGFYRSWRLTLVMMAMLPVIMGIAVFMAVMMKRQARVTRENFAQAGEISEEVLQHVRMVQLFGGEQREVDRFSANLDRAGHAGLRKEFITAIGIGSCYGITFASYGLAFYYGSILIRDGRNNVGEVTAVFLSVILGSFGVGLALPTIGALAESQGAASKLYEVIDREPSIDIRKSGRKIENFKGKIEFRNVSFSYPTRRDVKLFQNLSLTINAGQTVAFSGSSGCGKSSLIALVQRLYDPDEGQVLVDDVDVKELDLEWLRSCIGVVAQDPALFTGSVMDNVLMGRPDATKEEVEEACRRANVHGTITSLPDGYDTNLGAVGSQLSGGQKQRITIARAILKRPKMLILDEATSALDRKSEAEVQEALDEIMKDESLGQRLTVLVIAHRLVTIRDVDQIHYITHDDVAGSKVSESGTFDELMEKEKGGFAGMAAKQNVASNMDESATDMEASRSVGQHGTEPYGSPEPRPSSHAHHTAVPVEADTGARSFGSSAGATPSATNKNASVSFEAKAKEEIKHKKVGFRRVVRVSREKSWAVVVGMIGSLISGAVYPVSAVILSKMLEVLGTKTNDQIRDQTPFWAGMYVLLGVGVFIGWSLQGFYGIAGEYVTTKLRRMLFANLLRQDGAFFDVPNRDSGSLGKVLEGDTEAVHLLWGPALGFKVQMACNLITGVVIGLVFAWKLALITLAALPVLVLATVAQQALIMNDGKKGEDKEEAEDGIVVESLSNFRAVTAFNMGQRQSERYAQSTLDEVRKGKRVGIIAGIVFGGSQFIIYGAFALSFWYGGQLMQNGEEPFTDVIIASMAVLMGAMGAGEAGGFASKTRDARRSAKVVFTYIDHEPDINPDKEGQSEFSGDGATIDFNAVKFIYPARPKAVVLKKFSDKFETGNAIGLMGTTGCGKSTIIQLLSRYYDPVKGSIDVNGTDLRELNLRAWRRELSAVFQEASLLSGSVRDNIAYGRPDASDGDITKVAKIAAIHDEILAMPNGYDTQIGYQGRLLSGGQKQRVAIARALLRRPRLLLLDEATAALDNATEAKVQSGLRDYCREHPVTIVAVAHRLTTIRHSDKIVLLEAGHVLEEGTHEDLLDLDGHYAQRWAQYQGGDAK